MSIEYRVLCLADLVSCVLKSPRALRSLGDPAVSLSLYLCNTSFSPYFSRRKVTRMTLIISLIYILTWIPNSVIFLLLRFTSFVPLDSPADQLGILLVTFNSCINPIVYGLHSTPFSKRLKALVWCGRPRFKKNTVVPTSAVTLQRVERDLDDTSYRNEDFVENRIESRLSERSHQSIHSE